MRKHKRQFSEIAGSNRHGDHKHRSLMLAGLRTDLTTRPVTYLLFLCSTRQNSRTGGGVVRAMTSCKLARLDLRLGRARARIDGPQRPDHHPVTGTRSLLAVMSATEAARTFRRGNDGAALLSIAALSPSNAAAGMARQKGSLARTWNPTVGFVPADRSLQDTEALGPPVRDAITAAVPESRAVIWLPRGLPTAAPSAQRRAADAV